MEALYAKLYDKYEKLKKKKFSELDELNKDQEVRFLNYVSAAEDLIQHLKSENDRLTEQVNELKSEMASIRSTKDEQCVEYQILLMEENQKNKTLSEEVKRLQKLHQDGLSGSLKDGSSGITLLNTPKSSQIASEKVSHSSTRRMTRKRTRQSIAETEQVAMITPGSMVHDDAIVSEASRFPKDTVSTVAFVYGQQADCCKRIANISGGGINEGGPATCLFQAFIEYLVGMKLSATNQTEGFCVSALHQASGYSFSLTWVEKTAGEESELLYRVLSLGTFERIAPEWMREVLMFSMSMCPIFFQRIARVINLHN